jgi:hypothetical protein
MANVEPKRVESHTFIALRAIALRAGILRYAQNDGPIGVLT